MSSSNSEVKKVQQLLRQHRFRLVRQTKHLVYVNPEGRVYVTSATPSDHRFAYNQLTSLKRCLAAPPVPMVLAISEYEREQAAALIAATPRATAGASSGKHHHGSRGTGYKYVERVLTVEEIAERERLAEVARTAAARREQRHQERRARKLAQRAEKAAQKEQAEQAFMTTCGPFLGVLRRALDEAEKEYVDFLDTTMASPTWFGAGDFYQFAETKAGMLLEQDLRRGFHEEHEASENLSLGLIDDMFRESVNHSALLKNASAERIQKAMTFLEKKVRGSQDALIVLWGLYFYVQDNLGVDDLYRHSQVYVMQEVYEKLWALLAEYCEQHEPGALHRLSSLELHGAHTYIFVADSEDDEDALGMPPIPHELVDTYPYFMEEAKAEKEAAEVAA